MAVFCRQKITYRDGSEDWDEREVATSLEAKQESAEEKGWTIEETDDGFHAWKEYDDAGEVARKDRWFEEH